MATQLQAQCSRPIPAQAGIGLRFPHQAELLATLPAVGWLEAHSENFFADGGAQIEYLAALREHYPISLHGVGLSLGSTDPLDREHLRRLRRLVDWSRPALVSEHASWSSVGGTYVNDLLPLPWTEEALRHLVRRVRLVQDLLGRQILVENVSSYLEFGESSLDEPEFLAELAAESGCGLLLDVNNVYVSATNHGFDPEAYLARIPQKPVAEIHLAGHSARRAGHRRILIDTHSDRVAEPVWELYRRALRRFGAVPTLIEWDADLPELAVLVSEAARADACLGESHAVAA